jgi:hypothetical protein
LVIGLFILWIENAVPSYNIVPMGYRDRHYEVSPMIVSVGKSGRALHVTFFPSFTVFDEFYLLDCDAL